MALSLNFSSSFFGTTNNNTSSTGLNNMYGDYASIKNGSYKKLLTSYYKKEKEAEKKASIDTSKTLISTKDQASNLKSAANTLATTGKNSLFNEVTKVTKDKTTGEEVETTGYDREAITKAVTAFTESYNTMLDEAKDLESPSILKKMVFMTNTTKANKNLLLDAGITIGKDNKLSVDTEKLNNADINVVKTLFNGSNSYVSNVSQKASQIENLAASQSKTSALYEKTGNYSTTNSAGNLYAGFF